MAAKPQKAATPPGAQEKMRKRSFPPRGPHGGIMVLLAQDVEYLGKVGDVVEVRPGYARNYLLPRGLAALVNDHNLRLVEHFKEKVRKAREAKLADLRVLAEQIARVTVTIEANANEQGHLYGSVGPVEISQAFKAINLNVEPDMVRLPGVIKEANALYEVDIQLAPEIQTRGKVAVIGVTKS
jgi:large subunit ribosomal protein L9